MVTATAADSEAGVTELITVTEHQCLINLHLCAERKQITSTKGRVDCLRHFQTLRRPSHFPLGVKLMGVVPDYTHGNALYFRFQLRKLVPTIFSLGNHTVFCTCLS